MRIPSVAGSRLAPAGGGPAPGARKITVTQFYRAGSPPTGFDRKVDPKVAGEAALDAASRGLGTSPFLLRVCGKSLDQWADEKGVGRDALHRGMGQAIHQAAAKSGVPVSADDALRAATAAAASTAFVQSRETNITVNPFSLRLSSYAQTLVGSPMPRGGLTVSQMAHELGVVLPIAA